MNKIGSNIRSMIREALPVAAAWLAWVVTFCTAEIIMDRHDGNTECTGDCAGMEAE